MRKVSVNMLNKMSNKGALELLKILGYFKSSEYDNKHVKNDNIILADTYYSLCDNEDNEVDKICFTKKYHKDNCDAISSVFTRNI